VCEIQWVVSSSDTFCAYNKTPAGLDGFELWLVYRWTNCQPSVHEDLEGCFNSWTFSRQNLTFPLVSVTEVKSKKHPAVSGLGIGRRRKWDELVICNLKICHRRERSYLRDLMIEVRRKVSCVVLMERIFPHVHPPNSCSNDTNRA